MSSVFIKFPSIEHFRNVVHNVNRHSTYIGNDENGKALYDKTKEKPSIEFTQTVKIHGTNAGVTLTSEGEYTQQSRNRKINVENDNNGFSMWCMEKNRKSYLISILQELINLNSGCKQVTVFGEFAGGNIQRSSNLAVAKLPKSFYVFSVYVVNSDDTISVMKHETIKKFNSSEYLIFNTLMFDNKTVTVDFNNPELNINSIVDDTNEIDNKCPIGAYFGVDGVGEGVVLTSTDNKYIFKSKGEQHSVSKVKVTAKVDDVAIKNLIEFVDVVVTDNRLKQGIDYFLEMDIAFDKKNTSEFIKWVQADVKKEELDIILEKQLNIKQLNNKIANVARVYYFKYLDENIYI